LPAAAHGRIAYRIVVLRPMPHSRRAIPARRAPGWHPLKINPRLVLEFAVNLLLPWLAYWIALPHYGETGALYASAVPPLIWSLAEFARFRRVDALSAFVLLGIVLSIAAMALGGSPRMLLMRESLASGLIGLIFLGSLALPRPLTFYLARATLARQQADGPARFELLWRETAALRGAMRLMTLVWGAGLTLECLLRCVLVWAWPVERVLVVSPIVSYAIYGAMLLWTFWYQRRLRAGRQ
jgi:hypothetical protein